MESFAARIRQRRKLRTWKNFHPQKYFPFHLIFHSLNIEMEKLVEYSATWPTKNSPRAVQSASQFRSHHVHPAKGTRNPSFIFVQGKTVDFLACYFIGKFLCHSDWSGEWTEVQLPGVLVQDLIFDCKLVSNTRQKLPTKAAEPQVWRWNEWMWCLSVDSVLP